MQSTEIGELMGALSKAQGEIKHALKDSKNPFFKSNYADLASVKEACQSALTKYDLAVCQTTDILENGTEVLITTLGHKSGQWLQGKLPLKPVKNDPQAMGSALTYARRYALAAIVGVIADDDDGEAAMNRDLSQVVGKPIAPTASSTYNATPEHRQALVNEVKKQNLTLSKEDMKKISDRLVVEKVKLSDISKHL